jgi:hypothetical protein
MKVNFKEHLLDENSLIGHMILHCFGVATRDRLISLEE